MNKTQEKSHTKCLTRINLRLSKEMIEAIDEERTRRAGNVSRNTWIVEAIQEKLGRIKPLENKKTEGL